jgi:alkanesulfonate monooxygenase SsuD/methylene tetrahydromethanopterin reductase-like flavin-dependent oxidoreductase (luciferase family)
VNAASWWQAIGVEVAPAKVGVALVPTLPPERLVEVARTAEAVDLDELWVWEDCFKQSGVAQAAVALASTVSLRVGIGLLPAPLRNVALCAMELSTLERMFPGRLIAGVGHGVQTWMAQAGAQQGSPLTLLNEYASALRQLLNGERVTVRGRYIHLSDVAMAWPPALPPPLMVGGAGPKTRALAARIGDGVLLPTALTDDEEQEACAAILRARNPEQIPIVATLIAATGVGAAERIAREVLRWDRPADLGIGVAGDAAHVAERIGRSAAWGVTSVAIHPTADEPDLPRLLRFLGEEVKPLLYASEPPSHSQTNARPEA